MMIPERLPHAIEPRAARVCWSRRLSCAVQAAVATMMLLMLAGSRPALARHHRHEGGAAGEFDFYLLSLSWSPAFCLQSPGSPEYNGPRRFGFIVHGLWPQNERGWPQNCGGADVPAEVVAAMSDVIPSPALVQHEWQAHGTCSGLDPAAFFKLVRRAYASLTIPSSLEHPGAEIEQSPAAITHEFLATNPGLPADSVVTTCSRQGAPPPARSACVLHPRTRCPRLLTRGLARGMPIAVGDRASRPMTCDRPVTCAHQSACAGTGPGSDARTCREAM